MNLPASNLEFRYVDQVFALGPNRVSHPLIRRPGLSRTSWIQSRLSSPVIGLIEGLLCEATQSRPARSGEFCVETASERHEVILRSTREVPRRFRANCSLTIGQCGPKHVSRVLSRFCLVFCIFSRRTGMLTPFILPSKATGGILSPSS